jgi:branched-subunit amino acid transport protein
VEARLSAAWASVIAVGAGTAALKAVGPVVVGGRRLPPRLLELLSMLAPALLAALVIDEGFASGRSLVLDARVAGLAAGAMAVVLRAPIWVVVVAGAGATALVRLLT